MEFCYVHVYIYIDREIHTIDYSTLHIFYPWRRRMRSLTHHHRLSSLLVLLDILRSDQWFSGKLIFCSQKKDKFDYPLAN